MSDKTEHPPLPEAFAQLGIRNSILKGLADLGFEKPSEIQALLIPRALTGVDILGQARTGTGKTAAFGLPTLCQITRGVPIQAIIMTPTRELAVQVHEEMIRFAKHTPIKIVAVYGGQKIMGDIKALKTDPEIIVGTPGRVMDLLDRRVMNFDNIRFVILDEVDRMLDIGFREDIRNILSRVKRPESGNVEGKPPVQTIFVSATISDEIDKLSRRYMREPVEKLIAPGADDKPTVDNVIQGYYSAEPWDKYKVLRGILEQEKPELAIIFMRTKHGAEKLAKHLEVDGFDCREIHGNLNQAKRDKVMKNFKNGKFSVLVATDLASRGIDVAGVSHIINYDIPEDPEVYVHRIGRTARMGAGGKAYTLVTREQGHELNRVEAMINMIIPNLKLEGFTPTPEPSSRGSTAPEIPLPPKAPPVESPRNAMRLGGRLPPSRKRRKF